MQGQMTIFDWRPDAQPEPEIGATIREHGQNICHIMRPSYIGKKVCFDISTESMRNLFRVGVLEKIVPAHYWQLVGGKYERRDCDRVIIYDGKKQRSLISLMPGQEIYECLPWDAYPERMAVIGRRAK